MFLTRPFYSPLSDNDGKPDSNDEYTSASLEAGTLKESFTICLAFMVEAWNTEYTYAKVLTLFDDIGDIWAHIKLYSDYSSSRFAVSVGPLSLEKRTKNILFRLQWTRVCLSLDPVTGKLMLVADGQLLGEKLFKREDLGILPTNFSLVLGYETLNTLE